MLLDGLEGGGWGVRSGADWGRSDGAVEATPEEL